MTARELPESGLVVGMDVGGTSIKTALVDVDGHLLDVRTEPTARASGPRVIVDQIADVADRVVRTAQDRVVAVGVVVPGIVDEDAGVARSAGNLGWTNVPLRQALAERTGLPAALGHDVRAWALAESLFGQAIAVRDFLLVAVGTGVGAALFVDGAAYRGASQRAGEFGHQSVRPDGPRCECGALGCVEALASATAIARRYGQLTGTAGDVSATDVSRLAAANDTAAGQVWHDAVSALAAGIANYQTLLDPASVIVGGGVAAAGPALFVPLAAAVAGVLPAFVPPVPIVRTSLGANGGVLGAAVLAWARRGVSIGGRR